jgi:hypothetical protein
MKFEIDKPPLTNFLRTLNGNWNVISAFMKFSPAVQANFASAVPLADLLQHPEFLADCSALNPRDTRPVRYTTLNRLEFEGSLASILVEGGVTGERMPENEAKQQVSAALAAVYPPPFNTLQVFRFDDPAWCEFTNSATLSHSYIAWQSQRGLWWTLVVADYY